MTARRMPSDTPITIAITVSASVTRIPRRIDGKNRYWPTARQSRFGAVANVYSTLAAAARTSTANTQRHGWRSGIALIGSGLFVAGSDGVPTVTSSERSRQHQACVRCFRRFGCAQYAGTQLAPAGLLSLSVTAELAIAPSCTPQEVRSFV